MIVRLITAHQLSFSSPVSLRNCLGVLQLAACLREHVPTVQCDVPDLRNFNHLSREDFGQTMEALLTRVISPLPHVLGISTMSNNLAVALEICRRLKEIQPGVITVLGGPGVSFCAPETIKKFPAVDAVIRGEADEAFPLYIQALINGENQPATPGLVCMKGDNIIDNGWPEPIQDLDQLPVPAYEFCTAAEDADYGQFGDYNGVSLEAGRGCPFNCTFCSTSHFFKRKHRLKSTERLLQEIVYIRETLGDERIIFHHDILTLKKDYVFDLCEKILDRAPNLRWKCHARFDTIDPELLDTMRRAGCNEMFFGIECATPRMQKAINKRLDLSGYDEKVKTLKDLDYRFSLSFIAGFPGEEDRDLEALLDLAFRAKAIADDNVVIKIHTLVPLLGSDLYNGWKENLEYDPYGSLGTTDIPVHWKEPRATIMEHPEIFCLYYHFPIGEAHRSASCKAGMIGVAVDSLMKSSLRLAYNILGPKLAAGVARNLDKLELPPPASYKDTEYHIMTRSLRELVLELLKNDETGFAKVDAVSQFELAAKEVLKGPKDKKNIRLIETFYHPEELVKELNAPKGLPQKAPGKEKLYFMVSRDSETGKVKVVEIPGEMVRLLDSGRK